MLLTRFKGIKVAAYNIGTVKLNDNLLSIFILSMFCGILMYIAVNNHKKISGEIGKYIGILIMVLGNSVGSIIVAFFYNRFYKN